MQPPPCATVTSDRLCGPLCVQEAVRCRLVCNMYSHHCSCTLLRAGAKPGLLPAQRGRREHPDGAGRAVRPRGRRAVVQSPVSVVRRLPSSAVPSSPIQVVTVLRRTRTWYQQRSTAMAWRLPGSWTAAAFTSSRSGRRRSLSFRTPSLCGTCSRRAICSVAEFLPLLTMLFARTHCIGPHDLAAQASLALAAAMKVKRRSLLERKICSSAGEREQL